MPVRYPVGRTAAQPDPGSLEADRAADFSRTDAGLIAHSDQHLSTDAYEAGGLQAILPPPPSLLDLLQPLTADSTHTTRE